MTPKSLFRSTTGLIAGTAGLTSFVAVLGGLMRKRVIVVVSIAVAAAAFSSASVTGGPDVALFAATVSQHDHSTPLPSDAAPQAATPEMMKMHHQMMSEMKAADAKLEALVKAMNAATGAARVSAMEEVVTALVRQQQAMHERMASMDRCMMMGGHEEMMKK